MTSRTPPSAPSLFDDLAPNPAEHFKLQFFGTVLTLIHQVGTWMGSLEQALREFPFLARYHDELTRRLQCVPAPEAVGFWWESLEQWERRAAGHLPIRALREGAHLDHGTMVWLISIGLPDEDGRFGGLYERLQGGAGQRRPSLGFLRHFWGASMPWPTTSAARLTRLGLVQGVDDEDRTPDGALRVDPLAWQVVRGDTPDFRARGLTHRPLSELLTLDALLVSPFLQERVRTLVPALRAGSPGTLIVRGPHHNGRHTLVGALARALGRGLLQFEGPVTAANSGIWRQVGALSLLLQTLPVMELKLSPGETAELPELTAEGLPLGVVLGEHGGVSGPMATEATTLHLPLPGPDERRRHWALHLETEEPIDALATGYRLPSGQIHRLARRARTQARLNGRTRVSVVDVREAARAMHRESLDFLARPLSTAGDWEQLCLSESSARELEHLERRCRHREQLTTELAAVPGGWDCGVRSLFCGPSGTGKTLAARLLAGRLQKDIYRLDLSSVVNKYIGETEKNLHRVLERAEELDIVLLLDEGDALLGRRTEVQSANDRYANLETNFLLQRLETFQGLLIITTNARNRIDPAFERRMDVIVEFDLPDPRQRWNLWRVHLPESHRVDGSFLNEVSARCPLSGGQIRNTVVHASLLALEDGGIVTTPYLEAALRREYLKLGAACPLRVTAR